MAEQHRPALQKFVARQPIFERSRQLFAYELLFRSGVENSFSCDSADGASSSVIADSLLLHGIASLTGGKKAFVNVTREVLVEEYFTVLPRDLTVVELLETVKPDAEVVTACEHLKRAGYLLALDDFAYTPAHEPLLELADIVKVDFLATAGDERHALEQRLRKHRVDLLAEKVETQAELETALAAGYCYFQGYFFARPQIVTGRDIPASKLHYLQILKSVNAPDPDFAELADGIRRDASLCYKLLRYVNSALLGMRSPVRSIDHTLSLLGLFEVRKWVSLLAMAAMGADKPGELVGSALVRARFCEQLAPAFGLEHHSADLFLLGLFSLMDAILDRPKAEILDEVPLAAEVVGALLRGEGPLWAPFQCVLAYERADWEGLARSAGGLDREMAVPDAYRDAVAWALEAFAIAA